MSIATIPRLSYHCILAHQNYPLYFAIPPQTLPNFVHLLRADIVNGDNEDGFVFFQQALELVEINCLVASPAPHVFLELKIGYLRVKVCVKL